MPRKTRKTKRLSAAKKRRENLIRLQNNWDLSNPRTVKVYLCGVDWQHEIGACDDVVVYSSPDAVKALRSCWDCDGIVELNVTLSRWIEPQDFDKLLKGEKK